jgi:enoyl-CoA hydratase/carnithine racemase
MELTLSCDLIVATETSVFGLAEAKRGLLAIGGGCFRLPRRVPYHVAMEMILTGEIINAQEAFRCGLENQVVPADQLEAKTMEVANRIAEKSPIALRLAKEGVKLASRSNLDEGLRREVDLFALCFSSEDKDEGVKAFLEKRKADFRGK